MKEEDLLRTNGDNEDDNDDNIDGKWWWQSIKIKYILEKDRHMTITCRLERIKMESYTSTRTYIQTYTDQYTES